MTVELTFENFYQERLPYRRVAESVCMPVASVQVQILKRQSITKLTVQNTYRADLWEIFQCRSNFWERQSWILKHNFIGWSLTDGKVIVLKSVTLGKYSNSLYCLRRINVSTVSHVWHHRFWAMQLANTQCVAVCCSLLQSVAVCCSLLQSVAVCCSLVQSVASLLQSIAVWCSVLQCVTVCCSLLKSVAVYCSLLQSVAVCCSVLQVCCSVLQVCCSV